MRQRPLLLLRLNKPSGERASGAVMRLFLAVAIVASRDEADGPLARVMMRGKSATQKKNAYKFGAALLLVAGV
jgi:hypothetical protein